MLELSLDVEQLLSLSDEIGSFVELLINFGFVVLEFNFVLVDLLLKHGGEDVIDFQENNKGSEVHRLDNDALLIALWRGKDHNHNGSHSKQAD